MSPVSTEKSDTRRYGGVNGNEIVLTEKKTGENNKVIEFILRNDSLVSIKRNLILFCLALFLSNLTNSFTLVIVSVVALVFQCKRIATSVNFATGAVLLNFYRQRIQQRKRNDKAGSIVQRIETLEGMPGIHVQGIGTPDKARKLRTLPTLNVPGSYWLSHKENIYKFTFKYRETTARDSKEFLYKDELLKVIRQIIKCQPSQGQLNTIHLSIAYKHTFWTRQDKMFAMLKFHNKDGTTAFSQAFILTISLKGSGVLDKQFTSMITQADSNSHNDDGASPKLCTNSRHPASEISSDANDLTTLHLFPIAENDPMDTEPITTTLTMTIDSGVGTKNVTDISFDEPESPKKVMTERRSKSKMQGRDNRLSSLSETKRYDELTDIVVSERDESLGAVDDRQNSNWCKYLSDSVSTNLEKVKGDGKAERVVVGAEPIIPRSSDITNQVMEGLMFTIKQDEDNIKVVEQRTKMELDEVLENSEKIETKEGEKCLVNSSLLGLENLLTKIEVPNKQLKNNKMTNFSPKIGEQILSAATMVRDRNGICTAGGFSSFKSSEQAVIPNSRNNRILALSSLESNGTDHVIVNKLYPLTNGSVPIQLPKTKVLRISGDKEVIQRFHQNVIERKRRKLVLGKINSEINRGSKDIGKREIVDNRGGNISNSNNNESNGYADDNVGNDNDNNNNSNSNNNSNGTSSVIADEVQIDMWKLLQDITRGVKVMVERISDTDIKNATRSQTISTAAAGTMARRVGTRSTK